MIGSKHKDENPNIGLHNAMSAGTTVKGDIITETDLRLDGVIEGNIDCKGKIVIGGKGLVVGDIKAESAEISGNVKGNISVRTKLVLKSTAEIEGDIVSESLEIESNARFNGACRMTNMDAPA